jgi:hypothetical protein
MPKGWSWTTVGEIAVGIVAGALLAGLIAGLVRRG